MLNKKIKILNLFAFSQETHGCNFQLWQKAILRFSLIRTWPLLNKNSEFEFEIHNYNEINQKLMAEKDGVKFFSYPINLKTFLRNKLVKFNNRINPRKIGTFSKEYSDQFEEYLSNVNDVDIVHIRGTGKNIVRVIEICKQKSIPCILESCGAGFACAEKYISLVFKIIVRTKRLKKRIIKNYKTVEANKVEVLYPPVDTNIFKPLGKNVRSNYPRLLYVGSICRNKQLHLAVSLFDKVRKVFPKATLDVIGFVHDKSYYNYVKKYINKHNLASVVFFLGYIKNEDLPPYYSNSDILVSPSKLEAFSSVCVESMACETPPLVLEGSFGPEEFIDHNCTGFIVNEDNIYTQVVTILKDKERLKEIGKKARKVVMKENNLNYIASRLDKIYKEIIFKSC